MPRSLGLAAYRAMARRAEARFDVPDQPRPEGQLVWIHVGEPENMLAVQDLARRLMRAQDQVLVIVTIADLAGSDSAAPQPDGTVFQVQLPSEHPTAVKRFLDYWAPDVCIWVWGMLRPNLILQTAAQNCALILIDADAAGFDHRRARWLPDLTRQVLSKFSARFVRSSAGYKRLQQIGVPERDIEQTTPLLAGGQALDCIDSDLTELAAAMGGRPAWFAAHVMPAEIPIVLAAHKKALRLSHRLLLILQPVSMDDADAAAESASNQNLAVVRWDEGQYPDETSQVMITADSADHGLFFRVAPVSFLGGTLVQGTVGCDPLDAAALGSAVLYGPRVRHYMPSYSRLAAAGAARIVNDSDTLGTAISRLIAPDQAATMAHAGWNVISEGAAMTDRVVDLVQDMLDAGLAKP